MVRIGLIGRTNAGKTTFFNAATLMSAAVSTYPFTTKIRLPADYKLKERDVVKIVAAIKGKEPA